MFVYICRCAVRTLTVPSGLSDVLLRDQSFCASKMRELKHSVITKVDFACGSFQKHYPHARGNAADSPNDIFHAFYHPCSVHNQERESRTPAWFRQYQSSKTYVSDTQPHSSPLTRSQRLKRSRIKPKKL